MSLIRRFQQFHVFEDGDIFEDLGRNGVERINAELFWKRLPEAARLALAKAAPKYAGPWTHNGGDDWVRYCADLTAGYVYPYGCDGWAASEIDDREFATKDEAMAAEDEALRSKGWCLDG